MGVGDQISPLLETHVLRHYAGYILPALDTAGWSG